MLLIELAPNSTPLVQQMFVLRYTQFLKPDKIKTNITQYLFNLYCSISGSALYRSGKKVLKFLLQLYSLLIEDKHDYYASTKSKLSGDFQELWSILIAEIFSYQKSVSLCLFVRQLCFQLVFSGKVMNSTWMYNLSYIGFCCAYSRATEGSSNIQVSTYRCF